MTTLPHLFVGPCSLLKTLDSIEPAGYCPPDLENEKKPAHSLLINAAPTFYRGHFTLTTTGDTFLDVRSLTKGALWINGHPIGRFWNIGPQQTLYVPGPWLRIGTNEIVIFDLAPSTGFPTVQGLATPILDGPVIDTSAIHKQE